MGLTPGTVDINALTAVAVSAVNPHQGGEPVESLGVYLVRPGSGAPAGDTALVAATDAAGRASFVINTGQRTPVTVLMRWERYGYDVHRDSILVAAPAAIELKRAAPNPFATTAALRYQLSVDADVDITVYDLLGRKVKTLESGVRAAGYHAVTWDGTTESGVPASTGIYFCRLKAAGTHVVQKIMLVR